MERDGQNSMYSLVLREKNGNSEQCRQCDKKETPTVSPLAVRS